MELYHAILDCRLEEGAIETTARMNACKFLTSMLWRFASTCVSTHEGTDCTPRRED